VVKIGGFGEFRHGHELAPAVQQGIVRPNRDTLYSFAVFDLDAGPVTITLPEAGKRFMGMQVVNEDQYTPATYDGAGTHTLTRQMIGTRYAIAVVRRMFGANENEVDPVRHLIGTALLWGGLPEKDALYLPVTPARNDGVTIHELTVQDVPVDGFWSITVYNPEGYLEPNQYNAYAVNNITANKGMDGSVAIQFISHDIGNMVGFAFAALYPLRVTKWV